VRNDHTLYSPETLTKIKQWQERVLSGTITLEEMQEAIKILRQDRVSAAAAAAASGRKSTSTKQEKIAAVNVDDLLTGF
jgi:hypothetical protein